FSHIFLVDEDGKEDPELPRWISETIPLYPLESDRATSTKRYRALDPKDEHGGDFAKCLSNGVSVLIVHNPDSKDKSKVYCNVGNVTPAPRMPGYTQPALVNPPVVFELDNPN